ncbi:hypothetical protein GQ600_3846 [Phytophthora cactorum]|nr:hypothetical protein GQ600_3846 [Phytophthora cactorum]
MVDGLSTYGIYF